MGDIQILTRGRPNKPRLPERCSGPNCINIIAYPRIIVKRLLDPNGGHYYLFCSWLCVEGYAKQRARLDAVEVVAK